MAGPVRQILRFAWACWRPYRAAGVALVLLLVVDKLFWIGFAYTTKLVVETLERGGDPARTSWLLVGALVVFPAVGALGILGDRLTAGVRAGIANDMRRRMFAHLQRLSADFYAATRHGDVVARFAGDLSAFERVVSERVVHALVAAAAAAGTVALMWHLNGVLTVGVLAPLAVAVAVARRRTPALVAAVYQRHAAEADVLSHVQQQVRGAEVVRAFGLEARAVGAFEARLETLRRSWVESFFAQAVLDKAFVLAVVYVVLVAIAGGGVLVARGLVGAGTMVAFVVLLAALQKDLLILVTHLLRMLEASGGLRRVEELLAETPGVVDAPGAPDLPRAPAAARFEAVEFRYARDGFRLGPVSLAVGAGEHVAVVGPSGAGKTTLLRLLLRFYDATEGRVAVGGHDVRAITQASLRRRIGVVFQSSFLFDATILDNIRLFDADIPPSRVEAAARAAGIHEVVAGLPDGYATPVGEDGARLSAGQRQRLAIARALVRDPSILLLDEVTAALDAAGAAAVEATVESLARARTVVAVTHDLRQAARAPRIVVLDAGRVVGDGPHDVLLEDCEVYRRLWHQRDAASAPAAAARVRA